MIKALCFTQINNAADAVVCSVHQIIITNKQLLTNVVIRLSLGVRSKQDRQDITSGPKLFPHKH